MNAIVKKIEAISAAQQSERPYEMTTMRKRMGARNQNGSIALYAYSDMLAAHEAVYFCETAAKDPSYDIVTVRKMACDWIFFIADRIPRYYNFHPTSDLSFEAIKALNETEDRQEIFEILHALQHYYASLCYWIDAEIPWSELCKTYAEVMGDTAPND